MTFSVNILPMNSVVDIQGNQSLLEELIKAEVGLPYSCKRGICGACSAELMEGQVLDMASTQSTISSRQQILLCQVKARSNIVLEIDEITELKDISVMTVPCRVQSMELVAPDVMDVKLRIPPTTPFRFIPGQYIDFTYHENIRRSYSIADFDLENKIIELHIRAVENGIFSTYVFNEMKINDLLRFEGPLGTFFVRENSVAPLIFVAGGTGFAPVKAIINDLLRKNVNRKIHVYWGATLESGFYSSIPNVWARNYKNVVYTPVLSAGEWGGRMGYVHSAVLEDISNLAGYEVFVCGSPLMIEVAKDAFINQGLSEKSFFSDAFV